MDKRLRGAFKKKNQFHWWSLTFPSVLFLLSVLIYIFTPDFLGYLSYIDLILKLELSLVFLFGAFVLNKALNILISFYMRKHSYDKSDNLKERSLHTRMRYIKIMLNIAVFVVATGFALQQFDSMRQLSNGILASAGVLGIIIGFSAQKILGNLLAGLEIAFTQPIRVDDVVVVEDEWGRIEEINSTHVVVKIWDQRRLVLPISYFVTTPFQNWTKTSADIWGTVFFYVDYMMPIDAMRDELSRILKESPDWDGKISSVQVVDTSDKTMKVRVLMSSKDSSAAWDLRCHVREKMISFLQKEYPQYLPRLRTEIIKE